MDQESLRQLKQVVGDGPNPVGDVAVLRTSWRVLASPCYAAFQRVEVARVDRELYVMYQLRDFAMQNAAEVVPQAFGAIFRRLRYLEGRSDELAEEPLAV